MGDNTVRPAVACVGWHPGDYGSDHVCVIEGTPSDIPELPNPHPLTAIDGDARAVLARVEQALSPLMSPHSPMVYELAVDAVRRALGIPTEATTDGK
jgi:hypothetical protein